MESVVAKNIRVSSIARYRGLQVRWRDKHSDFSVAHLVVILMVDLWFSVNWLAGVLCLHL